MSLTMAGHIDGVFKSVDVTVVTQTQGGYVDGIWVDGVSTTEAYTANVQPLSERELDNLFRAGERIVDGRKVYINTGDFAKLRIANYAEFLGQKWKIVRSDVREWRRYAKLVVSRFDDQ